MKSGIEAEAEDPQPQGYSYVGGLHHTFLSCV